MDELEERMGCPAEERVGRVATAVFRGDEPECMVAAGLACPACLSGEVDWSLVVEPWDAHAVGRCRSCDQERMLSLTPDQALRLSIHGAAAPTAPEPRAYLALVP